MRNAFLSDEILNMYDSIKLRNVITKMYEILENIERASGEEIFPRITASYQIRCEQFIFVRDSKVEWSALKNMMLKPENKKEQQELSSKIKMVLKQLNKKELQVFVLTFYDYKNEDDIVEILHYNYKKVRKIRKSASVKFLTSLRLDYMCIKEGVLSD